MRGQFESAAEPALELRRIVINRGKRTVVGLDDAGRTDGMDLILRPGEIGVLQAPNGWGKTTLFHAIAGLHQMTSGSVRIDGIDVT